MSVVIRQKSVTHQTLLKKKQQGEKIVTMTCYDYSTARILDETDLDLLLVGDSLAMTMLGHSDTLSVTVDEMLHHVKAVSRGTQRTMIVADMPFMSYHADLKTSVENAGRFIQEGHAHAVKIEGCSPRILELVEHLVNIGIPVLGHLGFTPQFIKLFGGYRIQGKSVESAQLIFEHAKALEKAGCFGIVLEMIPVELAAIISKQLTIPTIGIGAGSACDGQVLVIDDLMGRYADLTPKFARQYMNTRKLLHDAIQHYCTDIETGKFPNDQDEGYTFPPELLPDLYEQLLGPS